MRVRYPVHKLATIEPFGSALLRAQPAASGTLDLLKRPRFREAPSVTDHGRETF
jgi:hypothetical protein